MSSALIKPGSTTTEDGQGLEILDLGRCNVLCSENKGFDQPCGCHAVDLCLCFSHMQKANFLITRLKRTWCILNKKNDRPFKVMNPILSRVEHYVRQKLTNFWE